ncbi:MAG: hypothetical protein R2748_13685 [Bryobacterales bacterium]
MKEQARLFGDDLLGVVAHDVAHDANEDQVDRVVEGVAYWHDAAVVARIEVGEDARRRR